MSSIIVRVDRSDRRTATTEYINQSFTYYFCCRRDSSLSSFAGRQQNSYILLLICPQDMNGGGWVGRPSLLQVEAPQFFYFFLLYRIFTWGGGENGESQDARGSAGYASYQIEYMCGTYLAHCVVEVAIDQEDVDEE